MNQKPKSEIVFDPDFKAAHFTDGNIVEFTRSEARLLAYLSRHHNQVVSRSQILDAISEPGSDKSDRTVDFTINRLRRKLDDQAKEPRFIQTRYGEGYVWVGGNFDTRAPAGAIAAVLGPIHGLEFIGSFHENADIFAKSIFSALKAELGPDVLWAPEYEPLGNAQDYVPELSIGLTFFREGTKAECVVSVRSRDANRIVSVVRQPISPALEEQQALQKMAAKIVPTLLAGHWRDEVSVAASSAPLAVAIQETAKKPKNAAAGWSITDQRLRALRSQYPDDPETKILYATHLHSKYVVRGPELFAAGTATCAQDEAEIEELVLQSLEFAQTQPKYAIAAAKLLYFVDRGYKEIAVELSETAHASHPSVAASLAAVGQLRAFCGNTEAAVDCLIQAAALSPRGTDFHIYSLALLCQALVAADDRDRLNHHLKDLYRAVPAAAMFFELLFSDPEKPSLRAKATTLMMSKKRAKSVLQHLYYVSARLFEQQTHRERALHTPLVLFQKRFGTSVVPDEVADLVPRLIL